MSDLKVDVQDVSPVEKRIEVVVPPAMVDESFNRVVERLRRSARIKGFRPGKVPRPMIEKMYAEQLGHEVAYDVINRTYFQAVKDKDIRAVEEPRVDNGPAEKGVEFKYQANVEVLAPIELKTFKGLDVKKPKVEVTDENVQKAIEQVRESRSTLEDVTDGRAVQNGDYAVIDLEGSEDGKPVGELSAQGFTMPVGQNMVFPELDQAVEGMKVCDTKEIDFSVPADAGNRLAGRTFHLKVEVKGLKARVLPELDDEFAKGLGEEFQSLEDLRKKVAEDIETRMKEYADRTLRENAVDALIAANPFEVAGALVSRQTDDMVQRAMHEYEHRGIDVNQVDQSAMWTELRPAAERRVRSELLLNEVAERENLQVDDARVEQFYASEAERSNTPVETIKRYYSAMADRLKDRLRLDEALELVIKEAKVTEVEPSAAQPAGAESEA